MPPCGSEVKSSKIEHAIRKVRRFPPLYYWWRKGAVDVRGYLRGEAKATEETRWPPALYPGAVMLREPDAAAHEFIHYLGRSDPTLMKSNAQTALPFQSTLTHTAAFMAKLTSLSALK